MGRYDTQQKAGCSSSPDKQQSPRTEPGSAALPSATPAQEQDYQQGYTVIVTGYTPVLASVFDGKRPASPHATEKLDSYTQDTRPRTDGEDGLQDTTMASFEVGPRNPTGDSGYGDSGLKSTISTAEHSNSSVQLAQPVNEPNHNRFAHDHGYNSDEAQDDNELPLQTHLTPVSSTAASQPKSAATPRQFTLASVHEESPPAAHPEQPVSSTLKHSGRKTMTLGMRKLLDTGQCNRVSSPNDDSVQLDTSAHPSQIHPSTSIKYGLTDTQYGDPQDTDPLFNHLPNSLVVSGVNATLPSLSVKDATYVHGSFSTPVARERDPLYRTPSCKCFWGAAGD